MPNLELRFPARQTSELITGILALATPDGSGDEFEVTTGLPGHQGPQDFLVKGKGPIPPSTELRKHNTGYEVSTNGLFSNARGIEGLFFPISPVMISLEVPSDSPLLAGGKGGGGFIYRGHFGIHFDANVPGSSGCIVVRDRSGFNQFCQQMQDLRDEGLDSLPLNVVYV